MWEAKKFRCSKGHEWTEEYFSQKRTFTLLFPERQFGPYCLLCIAEFLEANMGKVEEVPIDQPVNLVP